MTLTLSEARVLERLQSLPPERVEEVLDFIDFLSNRETTRFLAGRLVESLAVLEDADMPPIFEDEMAGGPVARRFL